MNFSQLKLDYANLLDRYKQLRQAYEQADQERYLLQSQLAKFEQDLRALQATRTVRVSRLIGQALQKVKASWQPLKKAQPVEEPILTAEPYEEWIGQNEQITFESSVQPYQPIISIILPIRSLNALETTVQSVLEQGYIHWELCLFNSTNDLVEHQDPRIKLAMPSGEFCFMLQIGDTLAPNALQEIVTALNHDKTLDVIYTDHDLLRTADNKRFQPFFKPDWSPSLLLSINYLAGLTVVRTELVNPSSLLQDSWLEFLNITQQTNHILHIPKILYHKAESNVDKVVAKSVQTYLQRQAEVELKDDFIRVKWPLVGRPKVSIIIPTKDHLELIQPCITSLLAKTSYQNYEVFIVDTGTQAADVKDYYAELANEPRIKILHYDQPFNYSAVNNWAAQQAAGDFFLFLNNDTQIISEDWLEEMLSWGQFGIVGAKLFKPDNIIQHAGVIVGMGGYAGHIFAGLNPNTPTIFGYAEWYRDYSAVTAACMLVRRNIFEELGGFEEAFELNGSDVDLCLRAKVVGYRVIYNPFAALYHLESATHAGKVPIGDYQLSSERYQSLLQSGDPYFNPHLSYINTAPTLKPLDEPTPLALNQTHQISLVIPNYDAWFWERYSLDAQVNAAKWDFDQADLELSQQINEANKGDIMIQSLTWFLPYFQHAYYGGIHTILRFAAYLQETHGVVSRFVILKPETGSVANLPQSVGQAFPVLQNAEFDFVSSYDEVKQLAATDAAIATFWTTAYYLLRFNQTQRKFYFVQDYEPLFYPAGSSYALAQATYSFGFYGLTNTVSLKNIYEQEYGGLAEFFVPAVNTQLFRPKPKSAKKLTLFFYGRPGQPRNAFELGILALRKLKERMGDKIRIVTAGADWNVAHYDLTGIVEHLGLLPYEQTAELYQQCEVGFVMMYTRHPSYLPFELMASGCLVVTNVNSATSWLLRHEENCLLSQPSVSCLATTLERGLTDATLRQKLTTQALGEIKAHHTDWDIQIEKIYGFMKRGIK